MAEAAAGGRLFVLPTTRLEAVALIVDLLQEWLRRFCNAPPWRMVLGHISTSISTARPSTGAEAGLLVPRRVRRRACPSLDGCGGGPARPSTGAGAGLLVPRRVRRRACPSLDGCGGGSRAGLPVPRRVRMRLSGGPARLSRPRYERISQHFLALSVTCMLATFIDAVSHALSVCVRQCQ